MMHIIKATIFSLALTAMFSVQIAQAATKIIGKAAVGCRSIVLLKAVSSKARGGTFIYKSNWDKSRGREQTYGQGNHSQKGAAFLVLSRSGKAPNSQTIAVLDANGAPIAKMARSPRCSNVIVGNKTVFHCGEHERWYLKTGSGQNVAGLSRIAIKSGGSGSILIPVKGNQCVKVNNVLNNREQA